MVKIYLQETFNSEGDLKAADYFNPWKSTEVKAYDFPGDQWGSILSRRRAPERIKGRPAFLANTGEKYG